MHRPLCIVMDIAIENALSALVGCLMDTNSGHVVNAVPLVLSRIDKWASDFGAIIYDVCRKATGLTDLQTVSLFITLP